MRKALLLAVTALSLASCNATALKGEADSQKTEWLNNADEIRVYDPSGMLAGSYEKKRFDELWYKLDSERSITVKSIEKDDEIVVTKLYFNVTYVITFKETIGEGK